MEKTEKKLEESYKALRVQYRFTERENENFMVLLHELKQELKELRIPKNCESCKSPLPEGMKHMCYDCYDDIYFPK